MTAEIQWICIVLLIIFSLGTRLFQIDTPASNDRKNKHTYRIIIAVGFLLIHVLVLWRKWIVVTFDNGRGPCRTSRYWKNRDDQRLGQSYRNDGVRVQLLRTDGLQGEVWKYLQSRSVSSKDVRDKNKNNRIDFSHNTETIF